MANGLADVREVFAPSIIMVLVPPVKVPLFIQFPNTGWVKVAAANEVFVPMVTDPRKLIADKAV